jgi:hypothetical protein
MRKTILIIILFAISIFSYSQKKDTISFIGVGDIMMGSNYPKPDGLPPNNGKDLMKEVESILSSAHVTMGNLEGVLLNEGGTPKSCRDPKVCYVFRSPEIFAENLKSAGFDLMSLANNHAGDFGDIGRKSSMKSLESVGILYAGQVSQPYSILEIEGIKVGFTAFAPNSNCLSINDLPEAKRIVSKLDSLADIVIVSFHGGAEGPQYQHVPRQSEIFHGENRGNVYAFAHNLIDAGADIIFGHGPHVTRAIELYKNRFVAYSLGNFCTFGGINVSGVNGLAPIIKVNTDSNGNFINGHITSTYQTHHSPVKIDSEKRVLKLIKELSAKDFPESGLTIQEDGWVTKSTR